MRATRTASRPRLGGGCGAGPDPESRAAQSQARAAGASSRRVTRGGHCAVLPSEAPAAAELRTDVAHAVREARVAGAVLVVEAERADAAVEIEPVLELEAHRAVELHRVVVALEAAEIGAVLEVDELRRLVVAAEAEHRLDRVLLALHGEIERAVAAEAELDVEPAHAREQVEVALRAARIALRAVGEYAVEALEREVELPAILREVEIEVHAVHHDAEAASAELAVEAEQGVRVAAQVGRVLERG